MRWTGSRAGHFRFIPACIVASIIAVDEVEVVLYRMTSDSFLIGPLPCELRSNMAGVTLQQQSRSCIVASH